MKSLTINSLIIFCTVVFAVPQAIAEKPSDTRVEKYENLTETETDETTDLESSATEAEVEDTSSADSEEAN